MTPRVRADRLLVERGLFESRAKAQAAIAAGLVTADDQPVRRPSDALAPGAVLTAVPAHPYVSRGAVKLAAALDHFGRDPRYDPCGRVCLDIGASTGGFTELLAARGARRVYAVDVGHDQLHPRLKGRPGILSLEGTDIRSLDPADLPEPPDFVVIDVSFIPLRLVIPAALRLVRPPAALIALIKPQFETPRRAHRKGIVRDPQVHAAVCADLAALVADQGLAVAGIIPSPITGGDGNREFLIGASRD
jgi:23S rRNA (cytidine1920-2'-O)/16S rRNA (cytidine1409-2'-O)-methyltransferase